MKKTLSFLLAMVMVFCLAACGSTTQPSTPAPAASDAPAETPSEATGPKQFFNIATGTMSGTYYSLGNALASLLNEKSEQNISFSAEATNGSGQNVEFLASGECSLALVNNDVAKAAYLGIGNYEGAALTNLSGITAIYANSIHIIVPSNSGIKSVADMAGKTVSVGAAGSGVESIARMIVAAYGMNYWDGNDFKPEYLGVSESMEGLKNGQIDAVFMTGLPPMSAIVDVFMSNDVTLIPLDADIITKLTTDYPELFAVTIKAGTYQDQAEDIQTVANSALLMASTDADEETIYQITKIMFENGDYLVERNNVWAQMTAENYGMGMTVPLHPGAERYFKEIGIIS